MTEKLAYTAKQAAEATGLSEWAIQEAIRAGNLPAKQASRQKIIIVAQDLHDYINQLPDKE